MARSFGLLPRDRFAAAGLCSPGRPPFLPATVTTPAPDTDVQTFVCFWQANGACPSTRMEWIDRSRVCRDARPPNAGRPAGSAGQRRGSIDLDSGLRFYASSFLEVFSGGDGSDPSPLVSSASAIRTSIATDLAPNFRITLPRCILTVTSLIESALATCLFMRPDATSAITCRSRAVRRAYLSRKRAICAMSRRRSWSIRIAEATASSKS